jgi:hypothetical protein
MTKNLNIEFKAEFKYEMQQRGIHAKKTCLGGKNPRRFLGREFSFSMTSSIAF